MKKKNSFNSFFVRTLITNAMVCMLVIVLIAPLCLSFYHSFYDRQKENLQSSLQIMLDDLSSNLNTLNDMICVAGQNENLTKICNLHGDAPASASWTILKTRNYITTVALNPYVADCVAAFSKNDLLITQHTSFKNIQEFQKFYSITGADLISYISNVKNLGNIIHYFPASQLKTIPFSPQASTNYLNINKVAESTALAFCCFIPYSVQINYGGCFLLIKEESLLDKLPREFLEKGSFTLTDKNGRPIYSWNAALQENPGAMELPLLTAANSPLQLSAYLHPTLLPGMLEESLRLVYFYLLAALLLVVLLSVYMTKRQFRPMRSILSQLQEYGYSLPQEANHLKFVEHALSDMQEKQQSIIGSLHAYRDQLQASQMERLLSGQSAEAAPVPDLLLSPYRVAYVYWKDAHDPDEISLLSTLVGRQLAETLKDQAILHQMGNHAFALLLSEQCPLPRLRQLIEEMNRHLAQPLRVICSMPLEGPEKLYPAFEAVRAATLTADVPGLLLLSELPGDASPIGLQICLQLHQALLNAQSAQAEKILLDIMENSLPPFENLPDAYAYCRLVMRFALRDAHLDPELAPPLYTLKLSPETMTGKLLEAARAICQAQAAQQEAQETAQDEEVLRYIEAHLHEPDLSAYTVAREFDLSERAIKRIVRMNGGDMSFSVFLQEQRMQLITRLLTDTTMPISEICERAGYATTSAFYKAFKRVYGLSPTQYRDTQK